MTTWRHANEWHSDFTGLTHCMAPRGNGSPCECTTPTPDPASPCAEAIDVWGDACLSPESSMEHVTGHEYRPSGCTCGHPIEANP